MACTRYEAGFGGELSEHKGASRKLVSTEWRDGNRKNKRNKKIEYQRRRHKQKGSICFSTSFYRLNTSTFVLASAIFL